MGNIRQLTEAVTNKIAAGEVVQRPASVVKELIENSLDAGATEITVVVENGGKDLIQIIDNGSGMDEDDLLLAFERHATSKITTFEDLQTTRSLGFRGEALASIAAVSMVDVRSCVTNHLEGRKLNISGGKFQQIEPTPMQSGTIFEIRKLFFNTPARRKFLKETNTEYRHIIETVRQFALGYPEVRFSFFANGREVFILPPASLTERIGSVFTHHYAEKSLSLTLDAGTFSIHGVLGNLDLIRSRSGEQYLFVNQRFVIDRRFNNAVFQAYGNLLDRGQFPFFVLNVTIDPEAVDVNVHPQKTEIKFRDEGLFYNRISEVMTLQLQKALQAAPSFDRSLPSADVIGPGQASEIDFRDVTRPVRPLIRGEQLTIPSAPANRSIPKVKVPPVKTIANKELENKVRLFEKNIEQFYDESPTAASPEISGAQLWQAHERYIFAQTASGVIIIDQFAAHERILFEKAYKILNHQGNAASQQLLFPISVDLSPDDHSFLLDIFPSLQRLGFTIREFGKYSVVIEAIPADMHQMDEGKVIREIIDSSRDRKNPGAALMDKVAFAYAAKAAVRSGDKLETIEMQRLIDELFQTPNPYLSPSGRPVIVQMSLNELDKRFERN